MHELSLATEIVDLVRPSIPAGGQLQAVQVTVGLLSGVCSDSLQFCFAELARQEGHVGAQLKIVETPAHYRCLSCDAEYRTESVERVCPSCQSMSRTMLGGNEFSVDFIEVE